MRVRAPHSLALVFKKLDPLHGFANLCDLVSPSVDHGYDFLLSHEGKRHICVRVKAHDLASATRSRVLEQRVLWLVRLRWHRHLRGQRREVVVEDKSIGVLVVHLAG